VLREQFEELRGRVLASVRSRLRAAGAHLDETDLEACYALAWQGLYMALLEGREIANPSGWLVLVTYRRALDEYRQRARTRCNGELGLGAPDGIDGDREGAQPVPAAAGAAASASGGDLAAELDDRARLRQLFEGLRTRLDAREREAAALCYLHGLSRAQAAEQMGMSEQGMRKLMDGRGGGREGVAGKVGRLVRVISEGDWCEEQGSLMRALAFGVLDPDGERHKLALAHSSQCPSCRAYVLSLRGLAAALPPVFLPGGLTAAVLAKLGLGAHVGAATAASTAAGPGAGAGVGASGAAGGAGASGAGAGVSAGAGAAGVGAGVGVGVGGAAGGGWLIGAGSLGGKFAVGCLLALSVGAGCVALEVAHAPASHHSKRLARARRAARAEHAYVGFAASAAGSLTAGAATSSGASGGALAPPTPTARATREFGPEQALAGGISRASSERPPAAHAASSGSASRTQEAAGEGGGAAEAQREATPNPASSRVESGAGLESATQSQAARSPGDSAAAEHEFSPG